MSGDPGPPVAVFGANGHTGTFVVHELLRRGLVPRAVGRDASKLGRADWNANDVETRTAELDAPDSLDRAFAGASVVINCAGPFLDTADAVAAASLRAGAHYIDVTAEQASAAATFERCEAGAREAGVAVVPAMGFYGGLPDLLVSAATGSVDVGDVTVAVALDRWHPTPGTRLTGARNTAPRVVIRDGGLVPHPQPPRHSRWVFPDPFGAQDVTEVALSEVPLMARHLRVSNSTTLINDTPLRDLQDPTTPPPEPVDESGRSAQRFVVDVEVGGPTPARVSASGRDIYAVTAPLVVAACEQLIAGAADGGGVFAPGELLDARRLLRGLTPDHLHVEIDGTPV